MGIIILLAVSVSLDTFGIGMAYRISGIRIPGSTKLVIAVVNGLLTFAAVYLGNRFCQVIPAVWFQRSGGAILVFLGAKSLWNALGDNTTTDYDKDHSHILEPWEGIVLGLTMALDSVCAGIGITGSGSIVFLFPVFTAAIGIFFLSLGARIPVNLRRINGVGGGILILLGIFRFCL